MEQKFVVAEKMESSSNENSIVGWASKPTIDRDKELILADAWQLDNYRKNPVVMLAHDYHTLPVGKCLWVKSTESGLRFKCKFANTERGKEVYDLYEQGFLNCFSVGFKPRPGGVTDNPSDVKYKGVKRLFTDVELMEISCVPIPAHSDALVEQSSFIKYVKDGNIITKGLKDELEAIIEIIEKSDDELTIEVKADQTDTEIKTEDPTDKGIKATGLNEADGEAGGYLIPEADETEKLFMTRCMGDKSMSKLPEPLRTNACKLAWKKTSAKSEEDIETKTVTPEKDEAEKDFMTRCMGDKSMSKLNEGFRTNACKLMWKKNQPEKKEDAVDETKAMKPMMDEKIDVFMTRCMADKTMMADSPKEEDRTGACQIMWDKMHPAEKKEAEVVEQKAAFAKLDNESEADFVARFIADEKNVTDYPDEAARLIAAAAAYKACGDKKKKEPEPESVITKQEQVDEFLSRILPEKATEIKTAEELAQVFEKASGYDDMKATVFAMEAQVGSMEPIGHPVVSDQEKSADAEGNPSLYDLTGAVDRALNPMGQDRGFPSPINGSTNASYRSVIDIFAVNYPSGHVVYSEYDRVAGQNKYFQIGYEYDLKMRVVTVVGEPEEVLQSWVTERYMIEKSVEDDGTRLENGIEVDHKDEADIETKAGKVLSAKNKKVLTDCMDQMMTAHAAMEDMMKMAEGNMDEAKDEEDIEQKDNEPPVIEEAEFEIIEKEEDHIEFDMDAPIEKTEDGMLDIDENMIKAAISSALKKNEIKVDTKSITEEVVARLTGRATVK